MPAVEQACNSNSQSDQFSRSVQIHTSYNIMDVDKNDKNWQKRVNFEKQEFFRVCWLYTAGK